MREESYAIWTRVRACSNGGCTGFVTLPLSITDDQAPGGCPYIFNMGSDSIFKGENNILHKSKFNENLNQDVTDKYLLKDPPTIMDNKHVLVLAEADNDIDYYDHVKLYAIDHDFNTKVGITEDNQIVLYDSVEVISTDYATKNSEDITSSIQYHIPPRSTVAGDTLDHLYVHFEGNNIGTYVILTEMEKDRIYPYPTAKDWVGNIIATLADGSNYQTLFSRREFRSTNVIPLQFTSLSFSNSMELNINMLKNYQVKYIALAKLSSAGYTLTEMPLSNGVVQNEVAQYNIDSALLFQDDGNYITLDNKSQMYLYFDIPLSGGLYKRDYILEVNGKYITDSSVTDPGGDSRQNTLVANQIKLHSNYPNPFNPVTNIKFELSEKGFIELNVYNILGQLVKILIKGEFPQGIHSVEFNASNLPSGVYFYQIKSGNYMESKKMVLIK